jgi:hypothetical protein
MPTAMATGGAAMAISNHEPAPLITSSVQVALHRRGVIADRWFVVVLAFVVASLSVAGINPAIGILPFAASVTLAVRQQRKARAYLKAARLCADAATCVLAGDTLVIASDQQATTTVPVNRPLAAALRRLQLPEARVIG